MAVTFVNPSWNHVNVQVRIGNNSNPESNPLVSQFTLSRNGKSQPFSFAVFLFWRRDSNPDSPNGSYTAWTQESASWDREVRV